MAAARTNEPFTEEVPRLLRERGLSMRAVAERAGVSQSHLSKVLRRSDYKTPSGDLARRVALALDLPHDYFPEYREAAVFEAVRRDARLRDKIYRQVERGRPR